MIKILLLSGALLALPLRAAILPLSPDAQAYADSLTGLTFCYPALQRPPYLEAEGGLLIDRMTRLAELLPVPVHVEKRPSWAAMTQDLLNGRCDLIPHVGPARSNSSDTVLSRAMMEAESAILYRGELDQAQFLVTHLAGPGDPEASLSWFIPATADRCRELVWCPGGRQGQRLSR